MPAVMKPSRRPANPDERTVSPFPGRWRRLNAWRERFHLREQWWRLLDFFEASHRARITLYLVVTGLVIAGALGYWAYPWWVKRNSIRIAQQWLAAGQLRYAAEAAQEATMVDPENPEPWRIAAELARRGGQNAMALAYARRAAELAPGNQDIKVDWAAAALRAEKLDEAERVFAHLPAAYGAGSPYVHRIRGEIARRKSQFTAARGYFESARRLEGPVAVNEVPLGLVLLNATDPAVRKEGLALLEKWTTDREWGANALRNLLEDALLRNDLIALRKWGEALRIHPGCTVGDMPRCLLALAKSDEPHYREVLATLEQNHAVSPRAAAQLLSWLNEIGRGADAVGWMQTLPTAAMQRPPLAVVGAEALRQACDWSALQAWTTAKDWGPDADFLRWTYGLHAARMLHDETLAGELWRTLYSHAQLNNGHALFAASLLYSWGRATDAEALWWRAANEEGQVAIDALGSLARYYQTQRDAEGQYRVFRQLHGLHPQDPAVGNNFAFFAAVTGREQRVSEDVARADLNAEPLNATYQATLAFVILQQNRVAEAETLLKPAAARVAQSPALAFVQGLILARTGHREEARALLRRFPSGTLTRQEEALIGQYLAD